MRSIIDNVPAKIYRPAKWNSCMPSLRSCPQLIVAGLCLLSAAAAAEQPRQTTASDPSAPVSTENSSPKLEELIVTGDRLQRPLSESAASVAVYGADELKAQQLTDLYDLLLRVPNVTASREDKFSLRGISSQGSTGRGRSLAHLFIDGVRQQGRGVVHTFDVEQIEIYRGPQSTAFGPNSLAGAVFVKTRDPSPEWSADLLLKAGSDNSRQHALSVSGPLGERAGLRLTTDDNRSDGNIENTTLNRDDWQRRERRMQRAKLHWDPGSDGGYSLQLTAQQSQLREGPELLPLATAEQGQASDNVDGFFDDDSDVLGLTQRWELGEGRQLTALTTASRTEQQRRGDYDVGPEDNGMFTNSADIEYLSQELRLNIQQRYANAVVGIYASRETNDSESISKDLVYDLGGARVQADADITTGRKMDTLALFGESDLFLTDNWTLTLGGRWEEDSATDEGSFYLRRAQALDPATGQPTVDVAPLLKATVLPDNAYSVDSQHRIFLPKLGVSYSLNDATRLFVTASTGYRAGGAEITSEGQRNSFDPETTYNYDVGAKWQGDWASINATLFYIDWRDQQVRTRPDANTVVTRNAGRSTLQGAELEVKVEATPSLALFFGAGYVETRFVDFRDRDNDYSGQEFAYAPHYNLTAGLQYRHHHGWFINTSASYTDGAYASPDNDRSMALDSFSLVNAKLGYETARFGVYAYGQNLLDEFYVSDHFRNDSYGLEGVIIGQAREMGLGVELHW